MNRKRLIVTIFALLCLPAFAVFNERDLGNTLSVLRYELKQEYERMRTDEAGFRTLDESQHQQMVDMIKKYNELSLMLYSQNEDYTFDMTYALKEISREYELFTSGRLPYDSIVSGLDEEIDRYTRLLESLRRLPAPGDVPPLPDSLRSDSLKIRIRSFRLTRFYLANIAVGGTPALFRQGLASLAALCLNAAAGSSVESAM